MRTVMIMMVGLALCSKAHAQFDMTSKVGAALNTDGSRWMVVSNGGATVQVLYITATGALVRCAPYDLTVIGGNAMAPSNSGVYLVQNFVTQNTVNGRINVAGQTLPLDTCASDRRRNPVVGRAFQILRARA